MICTIWKERMEREQDDKRVSLGGEHDCHSFGSTKSNKFPDQICSNEDNVKF